MCFRYFLCSCIIIYVFMCAIILVHYFYLCTSFKFYCGFTLVVITLMSSVNYCVYVVVSSCIIGCFPYLFTFLQRPSSLVFFANSAAFSSYQLTTCSPQAEFESRLCSPLPLS